MKKFIPAMFKKKKKSLPKSIIIEATNICNLKCPVCPTHLDMRRPRGFMQMDVFKYIIDDIAGKIGQIWMNFAGEPTLNRHLWEFVKYANSKRVRSNISTNSTMLVKQYEEMVEAQPEEIVVCLDGATKSIHELYRQGSDFDRVVEGISKASEEKRKRGASKPHLNLQFVVMAQNEHQIDAAIELSRKIGVDSITLKTMSIGSDIDNSEKLSRAEKWLPRNDEYNRYHINKTTLKPRDTPRHCTMTNSAVIYWDGSIGTCCYDFNGLNFKANLADMGGFTSFYGSNSWKDIQKRMKYKQFELCQKCNLTTSQSKRIQLS